MIYHKTKPAIQRVTHEIIHCPYEKAVQRLFLQGKSQELIALILAPIVADQGNPIPPSRIKPKTIARLEDLSSQEITEMALEILLVATLV